MTNEPQQEVAEHALAVLGTFLADYTDPDDDGHRARVVVVGGSVEQGFFDVQVVRSNRSHGFGMSPKFRVSVSVEPLPEPVGLTPFAAEDESSGRGGRPVYSRDASGVVRPVFGAGFRS